MKKIAILVANNSEDIEVVVPTDIWRRAGIKVDTISIYPKKVCVLANSTKITCDSILSLVNLSQYDMIYLPGGQGYQMFNAKYAPKLVSFVQKNFSNDKYLFGAICAAPVCLYEWGLLDQKIKLTCYPGMQIGKFDANYVNEPVVISGNLITASGPGAAHLLALNVIKMLVSEDVANKLFTNMQWH